MMSGGLRRGHLGSIIILPATLGILGSGSDGGDVENGGIKWITPENFLHCVPYGSSFPLEYQSTKVNTLIDLLL